MFVMCSWLAASIFILSSSSSPASFHLCRVFGSPVALATPSSTSRPTQSGTSNPAPTLRVPCSRQPHHSSSPCCPKLEPQEIQAPPSSSKLLIQLSNFIYPYTFPIPPPTTTSPLPDHTSLAAAPRGCPPLAAPPAQPSWSKPAPSSGPVQRGCAFRFSSAAYVLPLPSPIQTPVLRRHRGHNRLAPSYQRLVAGPCRWSDLLYPSLSRFERRYRGGRCHGIMLTPLRALPLC